MSQQKDNLLYRIRVSTAVIIIGLVLSGLTAIPLQEQVDALVQWTGAEARAGSQAAVEAAWAGWLTSMQAGLRSVTTEHPWLYYGTDWLAFAHVVIAIAFIGAWRDPVRNIWVFQFGLIACMLVVPWAVVMGGYRGIPWWWRAVDCSFGVGAALPLWLCLRWTKRLETTR